MKKQSVNLLSKLFALCLVFALVITIGLPAKAEISNGQTGTITVTGKETDEDATVSLYKMIDVKFDYEKQQPISYTWCEPFSTYLKKTKSVYINMETGEVTDAFSKLKDTDVAAVVRNLSGVISDGQVTPIESKQLKKDDNYSISFSGLNMGQYLVLTTPDPNGAHKNYVYAPNTANLVPEWLDTDDSTDSDGDGDKTNDYEWVLSDANIVLKASPGGIEKSVDDPTVAIGDIVTYTLKVQVPKYPVDATTERFKVGDLLSDGLTFQKGSVQIGTADPGEDGFSDEELIRAGYEIDQDGGEDPDKAGRLYTFLINFNYDYLRKAYDENGDGLIDLDYIWVQYTAELNENAFTLDEQNNIAYVGQDNDPYDDGSYEPTDVEKKVYTYGIHVNKVDEKGAALKGAEFKLTINAPDGKALEFVEVAKGQYRFPTKEDGEIATTSTLKTDAEGHLDIKGLEDNDQTNIIDGVEVGAYYLTETKAPDGYQLLSESIQIILKDSDKNGILDEDSDNIFEIDVENTKPPILPITGGMGTIIFSTVGIILMAGGIALVVSYRRRKRA